MDDTTVKGFRDKDQGMDTGCRPPNTGCEEFFDENPASSIQDHAISKNNIYIPQTHLLEPGLDKNYSTATKGHKRLRRHEGGW
jgi:hypothetical protein